MKGGTLKSIILKQLINRSKVLYTYKQGLRWCHGIASALASMHSHDPMIIHRDLKCDNILLTNIGDSGIAKIADLGLHALVEKPQNSTDTIPEVDKDELSDIPNSPALKQMKPYEVVKSRKSKNVNLLSNGQADMEAEVSMKFWKMTGE